MSEVHEEERLGLLRRFQRPILLGLVIFALLTFSITGAALMMFETDPTEVGIVLLDGSSATIGGRAEEDLERASFRILGSILDPLLRQKDALDRDDDDQQGSDQVRQEILSLRELREFTVWIPFYERVEGGSTRNRDIGVSHDDYTILSGAAQAAGIRFDGEVIAEKTQAILQLFRSAGGDRAAELDEAQLHRMFNLRPAGFEAALSRALAATELVRRLEVGLEAVPTPEEVLEGWKKSNPQMRATVAVFAASLYEEEARKVFELLFPTEEEREAEIRRWKEVQVGAEPLVVDDATKARREKVRVEDLDKRKDAAEGELAQAIEAQAKAAAGDEPTAVRVRAARRDLLWLSYLDKLVDRRTHYAEAKDDAAPSTKDALKDFEGRRWLLFGLDLDSMTEAQEAFLLSWLKEKQIEEPTLKEVAEHYRKYANSRFLTEEGRRSRNLSRWERRAGGAMPRAQDPEVQPKPPAEGAASGAESGQGGETAPAPGAASPEVPAVVPDTTPADAGGPQAGPAPAVPEGMLATADRPDMMVNQDTRGWDDPGVQFQARRDLIAKRFFSRFLDVVVSPALEDATKAERVALAEAETALAEKTKAADALVQRAREINTELNSGGDGRGLQRYLELKRAEDSAKATQSETKAQVERLEKLPEAQREGDYAQKLEDAKKRLQTSEQELASAAEALKSYLVDGLPRVRTSLLNGRAAGVTSALSMLGFGELVAKSGETSPAEAATQASNQAWSALSAAEQNAVGGAATWDAADQDAQLALLVRATSSVANHPQAGAVDAAWRAVARAKLSAIVTPVEAKRAELHGLVTPASTSVAEAVDRLAALRIEIPALDASLEKQDRALSAKREELQRAADDETRKRVQAEIDALQVARDAQAADRATKVEERGKLEGEKTTREQAFETQRAAAFDASAGWAEALGALEAALRAIELADPSVASLEARAAAVAEAEKRLVEAEAAKADVSALDKLNVELVALVERRLEAYERRRTLTSQAAARASEVRNAYGEWREALDPAHATQLQSLLVEYGEWGAKNAEAAVAQVDAQTAVDAAKNALSGARIGALPVVLERLRSEIKAQSGAAALDLVIQEIPGWVTREDLRKDHQRSSNDMPEGGGNPILEGAVFGPAGQLEEGALGKNVAISQRYAFVPGLLDAGGGKATEPLARRAYLRDLALEIARDRAAICSEMLDEIERLNETEAEKSFVPGSEVKREEFERELKEGEALYLVKDAELPSQEVRFRSQTFPGGYYQGQYFGGGRYFDWKSGAVNPDWFRKVTSLAVRRTFDSMSRHIQDIEGEILSAQPFEQVELEAWFVAHVARRPLDPEADGARISPRDWMTSFRELRRERMAKSVRSHLTGDGLRKTFQIARR